MLVETIEISASRCGTFRKSLKGPDLQGWELDFFILLDLNGYVKLIWMVLPNFQISKHNNYLQLTFILTGVGP